MEYSLNKNSFDPQKSFFELNIVRWTAGTIFGIALLATSTILTFSDLSKDLSYNGFNQAITVFKFPLGVLATLIPMIALLATNHRSEQTKEQIKVASNNNNFTNYFKHLSEFESYIEKHKVQKDINFKSLRNLHKLLFPQSKKGNFRASPELKHEVSSIVGTTINHLESLEEIKTKLNEIEENHSQTKNSLLELETASARKLEELHNIIKETEGKPKISQLGLIIPNFQELENAKQNQSKEKTKLQLIREEIGLLNKKIDREKEPGTEDFNETIYKLQSTANQIINKAKIKKTHTVKLTATESEEKEYDLITKETRNEADILKKLASAIQAIDISLQFDEEYETPSDIEFFINLFININDAPAGKYKNSIEKYKEQFKSA